MTIRFTQTADANLLALVAWLAERSPKAARRAVTTLLTAIDRLDEFPELAPSPAEGLRDMTVRFGRDGFIVRYRVDGPDIVVEDILHGRQERQTRSARS